MANLLKTTMNSMQKSETANQSLHLTAEPHVSAGRLKKTNPRQRDENGITLLEVMVAMGIAAIVLTAVYRLQTQSITMDGAARFQTQAPLLAQQLVTEIELKAPEIPASESGDFGTDYPGYSWTLETADVENFVNASGRALLKQIEIKIHLNRDEDLFTLRTYRLVSIGS